MLPTRTVEKEENQLRKRIAAAILMCAVMVLVAAAPLAIAQHIVVKGPQGPRASSVTWNYEPQEFGTWYGHIVNNGLRSLVVDVYQNDSGMLTDNMHQRIRFAAYLVYPTGEMTTEGATMSPGHLYTIVVIPNGPRDSSCTVDDVFVPAKPPVAVIDLVSQVSLTVVVDGSGSSDPDGTIMSYDWAFGDGTGATGMGVPGTVSHTYSASNTYDITLTVTDNDGLISDPATLTVTVSKELMYPVALFTPSMAGMVASVDATASYDPDGTSLAYAWNFGDGSPVDTTSGVKATHTYTIAATYPITLTVTDADNLASSVSHDVIAVMNTPPVLGPIGAKTVNELALLTFTATATDADIPAQTLTFSLTGTVPVGASITPAGLFTWTPTEAQGPGDYTFDVVVSDGVVTDSETITVHVNEDNSPTASFTYAVNGQTVTVTSTSTDDHGIVSYVWSWGDKTADDSTSGMLASHTYVKPAAAPSPGAHLIVAGPIALAPGQPFLVKGIARDSVGAIVVGADVTITNMRLGVPIAVGTYVSEFDGYYEYDMGYATSGGVLPGDVMVVNAVKGTMSGSNQATVPNPTGPYIDIGVTLTGGSVPVTVIYDLTLTVKDAIGQTTSVTQKVSITFP